MNPIRGRSLAFRCHVAAWSILLSIFVLAQEAAAGWFIEQVAKGAGEGGRQQLMLQANRMKTLLLGEDGKPTAAFILDLDAQTITQVEYEGRHYTTATVQEFAQMLSSAMRAGEEQMAEAMKQMQERLKEMPPEQRKMVEEMMRSQMPGSGQECREPKVELRKTGEQATIAGYPAVRYDVLTDGSLESELWLAKGITAWREIDPKKLERFSSEMAKLASCGRGQRRRGLPGDDPAWKLASEGFPVRMVHPGEPGVTVEVVQAESRAISAAEFQPPVGFARKTLQEMMRR